MYSIETKLNMLKALESMGGHIGESCRTMNISRSVFYLWMKSEEVIKTIPVNDDGSEEKMLGLTFSDLASEIIEKAIDNIESSFYRKCLEGDTTAMIFYLKTKGRNRGYIEKHQISGLDNEPIIVKIVDGITN